MEMFQQSSVKFVPGDQGHQPRDHGPHTRQCGENYGKDHSGFIKADSWTALRRNGIRNPTERVADVRQESIHKWAEDHREWFFKVLARFHRCGTCNHHEEPSDNTDRTYVEVKAQPTGFPPSHDV